MLLCNFFVQRFLSCIVAKNICWDMFVSSIIVEILCSSMYFICCCRHFKFQTFSLIYYSIIFFVQMCLPSMVEEFFNFKHASQKIIVQAFSHFLLQTNCFKHVSYLLLQFIFSYVVA